MLNSLALQGARVVAGRADNLHVSGHAYQVRQADKRNATVDHQLVTT
jgi:mRNA degradation ribonuclease J1/J2